MNPNLGYWAAWLAPDTPHVATFHAFGEEEPIQLRMARALVAPLVRPFFQRAFAVSEPARRWAASSWKRPLGIIPNGVAMNEFPRREKSQRPGPVKLLFVGRLDQERKGFQFLLEAFGRLTARGVPVSLDVVGHRGRDGYAPSMPGVTYHGQVARDALVARYRGADVFVVPSTGQESFGIVLLEAMATSRAIICSSIEGYRQVVDARGALFVPPRDVDALEHAITRLVAAPEVREEMRSAWNRLRAQAYDWEQVAGRVREEYVSAIALHAHRPGNPSILRVAPEATDGVDMDAQPRSAAACQARVTELVVGSDRITTARAP